MPDRPVAANTPNTLAPNMVRLPIGRTARDSNPVGPQSYFWLMIPTRFGGLLTVRSNNVTEGSSVQIINGSSAALTRRDREVEFQVPRGQRDPLYIVAEGGGSDGRSVSCTFAQTGIARDGRTPLVPFNFWFWPSARQFTNGETNPDADRAIDVLRRYAQAVSKDADIAERWERDNHGRDRGPPWMGHCHNMAAASILFEEPVNRTIAGVSFTAEELELIAGEWYGAFGQQKRVWTLERGDPVDNIDKLRPTHLFKPAEPKTPAAALQALRSHLPDLNNDSLQRLVAFVLQRLGPLETTITSWFGERASALYAALVENVLVEGHALVGDLRSAHRSGGAGEVWNHAVFAFRGTYREVEPVGDWKDIEIECTLFANEDYTARLGSVGLPAAITNEQIETRGRVQRISFQGFRLVFDDAGDVAGADPRNLWRFCRNATGDELYAPSFLLKVEPVSLSASSPRNVSVFPLELGNISVGMEAVGGALSSLTVRRRYRA